MQASAQEPRAPYLLQTQCISLPASCSIGANPGSRCHRSRCSRGRGRQERMSHLRLATLRRLKDILECDSFWRCSATDNNPAITQGGCASGIDRCVFVCNGTVRAVCACGGGDVVFFSLQIIKTDAFRFSFFLYIYIYIYFFFMNSTLAISSFGLGFPRSCCYQIDIYNRDVC